MKPIAITLGDPAGIGSEVVFKALAGIGSAIPVRLFGAWDLASQAPHFNPDFRKLFVDVGSSAPARLRFGQVDAQYGKASLAAIDAALNAIDRGECSALVTAPIHKEALVAAGSKAPGHTELLAARSGLKRYAHDYAMFFDSPSLRVVLLSVHIPLREVVKTLREDDVVGLARLTRQEIRRIHGLDPRIAVAGVNPHAGEGGMFGDEEKILAAGVERAQREGVKISGPHSADTVFLAARRGRFDVVMAAYHDQGLIPIKTVEFERSVNVTLGLPYLRCSVDHGTAFDIAGKGIADAAPMRYAIEWAARHAEKFKQ